MSRILLAAIGLVALSLGPARAQQMLGDSQINTLLVGKSALFVDYSVATYGADGSYAYIAANNLSYRGRFAISGAKLCLTIEHAPNRCDAVGIDGQGPYLLSSSGPPLRFTVKDAIAPLNSATLCGESVAYNLLPPAATMPENIRAFSGTWVGKWDNGLCGALIVENLRADGVVSLISVNGSYGGQDSIKAGSVRFAGLITGGTLTDGGKVSTFQAVMHGPNRLAVTSSTPRGFSNASFTRQ